MRIDLKINYKTPFIETVTSTYIDKNGNNKKWDWVRRKNNQKAVMIVALDEYQNKIVVTKEYREPISDYEWGFPAGLIDNNESPVETATRELKEETGLNMKDIHHVSPPVYNSPGLTNESIYIVFCTTWGRVNQKNLEANEDIETFLFSREEIKKLIQDPTKKFGAKAYLLMLHFIRFGKLY